VLTSGRRHPDHIGASGRLVVADQQTALRAVGDLLTSLGGVEIARRTDAANPAEVLIEGRLPREAYPAFVEGLARMGTWAPDAVPRSSEESLLVAVRIVR
jgi:hypothetical protein